MDMLRQWLGARTASLPDVPYEDLRDDTLYLRFRRYGPGSDYVGRVPCYFYSMVRMEGHQVVGTCDLRVGWNNDILMAGHIGYRVFHAFRGHGYAEHAARLLLALAHRLDMQEVLITCDPDNGPSRRTLEKLDGRYVGIAQVPEGSAAWRAGNREKCQFYYKSADFALTTA